MNNHCLSLFLPTDKILTTPLNDLNDIALKIRSGDERAFEQVFRMHYKGMCGYAKKYLTDIDEAEETVQEVFSNYWHKKENLEITGSLEAYLYRAVRNSCLNHLKHLRIRTQYAHAQEKPLREEENRASDAVVELELQQKIDDCIELLPAERQKIFKLSRFEGLKYQQIADQLGISVKTVENQMGKALKFLRENLSEYLPLVLFVFYWLLNFFY